MLDHLDQLAFVFRVFRKHSGLSQEELARKAGPEVNRSVVALLEQGRRPPPPQALKSIAEVLQIPEEIWQPYANKESGQRQEFEAALGELVGRTIVLKMMHVESVRAAERNIRELFSGRLTVAQAHDTLNSILVFYGVTRMTRPFFDHYFGGAAFQTVDSFQKAIVKYQAEAIRLFSTFGEAYRRLNATADIGAILAPLKARDVHHYSERTVWEKVDAPGMNRISKIEDARLPYLGYISVETYRKQRAKRELLAKYLRELAESVRKGGAQAVDEISEKRRRKIDSLLRELDSILKHTPLSPLFAPNPAELEAEAARILRDESDEKEMEATQSEALANLSNYVCADYMDVYVATSMRTESDFVAVNQFVTSLFAHDSIAPLRLRYFNPTQSWIEDRVAKGLVEALMLRRADYAVYMAQKGDTFGKDSEASVALGQGKPVIVYVPKLVYVPTELDSEGLRRQSESRLRQIIAANGEGDEREPDEELDHDGLFTLALTIQLKKLDADQLRELVRGHWADYGLLDETDRIRGLREAERRDACSRWLRDVIAGQDVEPTPELRSDLLSILVALTVNFEKRAKVFREVHPLALQVILSTGVLNGILVCRSVDSCASLLRGLIENTLGLELKVDEMNYRLVEMTTDSTIRVISRNNLLTNAFDTLYERG